jgi:thioredoxin-related protein
MKKVIFTVALWFCLTSTAYAAEMLMFSTKTCGYCRAFLKEVAPTYADTEHAKLLPLRIISMDQATAPKWFDEAYNDKRIDPIVGTPTFVIFNNGTEVARLIGYQGKEKFYKDISQFINSNRDKLEQAINAPKIPYEQQHELDPKDALREEGSHTSAPQQSPFVPFNPELGMDSPRDKNTNPHTGELEKFPNGVYKSRDILDHQYETETEAQVAANFLGCLGTHEHMIDGKKIYMPCTMK